MSEVINTQLLHVCRGCSRTFDDTEDVCQVPGCRLCRRCHQTALGNPQPHKFNDEDFV